ncbi:protein of unknown function DUF4219 - like 9 [Theobroma cacao]|nr:protein of unknown function DUF4219 - like 9 [Theobroma cacao]
MTKLPLAHIITSILSYKPIEVEVSHAPPMFTSENYAIWLVKMKSYLKAFCIWEVGGIGEKLAQRHANATLVQIRQFEEDKAKRNKALSCLQSVVSDEIFTRIMHLDNLKDILGIGTVVVETQDGNKYIFDVYFVPNTSQNLLSVRQLIENHYALLFKDKYCAIFDHKGEEVLIVEIRNKCYLIDWKHIEQKALFSAALDSKLWHKRLGHINYNSLQVMTTKELVEGEKVESNWEASAGSYRLKRFCWIYFLKLKEKALSNFVKFRNNVENQVESTIKTLRSDNDTEFTSAEFETFLSKLVLTEDIYIEQPEGHVKQRAKTSRPNIMFSTSLLSRFIQSPSKFHFRVAKKVLRYVKATANHIQWLRKILTDLGFPQAKGTVLNVDNKSAIDIVKNLMHHGRTKHIKVKYHTLREAVKENEIDIHYYTTDQQFANILTQGLSKDKLEFPRSCLGVY